MTIRDDVWDAVIEQLITTGKFKLSDLPFDESKRHTVRRVLNEMEENNWLTRDSENAAIWRLGEKAKLCLNVKADTLQAAQS